MGEERRTSGRPRPSIARYVAGPAPNPHKLRLAMQQARLPTVKLVMRSSQPPPPPPQVRSSLAPPRSTRGLGSFVVEEICVSDARFKVAKAEVTWELLDGWANTPARMVVRRSHLWRLFEFTSKLLVVRRADGALAGCALLSEAPANADVCDTLHSYRNPSLPMVRTARMARFAPIRAAQVRAPFGRGLGAPPIDELVLICGERGIGAAVMAHLRGRPRILFASVVPGSERARTFYDKYFTKLGFERRDGEWPYAAWLAGIPPRAAQAAA